MKSSSILVIHNPVSGRRKKNKAAIRQMQRMFAGLSDVALVYTDKNESTLDTIRRHAKNVDIIVCNGGDGTLSEVVSATICLNLQIPICHVPIGTTNDLARTLKLPLNIKKALSLAESGKPLWLDSGLLNDTKHFIYVAAFGAFVNTAYNTRQSLKNKLGYVAYLLSSIQNVDTVKPYAAVVEADGQQVEGDFLLGFISNSLSVAGLLKSKAGNACLCDGKLDLCLIRFPKHIRNFLSIARAVLQNRIDYTDDIIQLSAQRITITFPLPVAWTLDGEQAGAYQTVTIQALEKSHQIICETDFAERANTHSNSVSMA